MRVSFFIYIFLGSQVSVLAGSLQDESWLQLTISVIAEIREMGWVVVYFFSLLL